MILCPTCKTRVPRGETIFYLFYCDQCKEYFSTHDLLRGIDDNQDERA